MECPRCGAGMQTHDMEGHGTLPVTIDVCVPCQAIWFDSLESPALAPAATLALFRLIGAQTDRPNPTSATLAKCPRCHAHLRLTKDRQHDTRFEYLRCPHGHGRLTPFLEFLKEKDFIRPLTAAQIEELRLQVQSVTCASCGAPVDLTAAAACAHCGAPLCMLDVPHAEQVLRNLSGSSAVFDGVQALERWLKPADKANGGRA